MSKERYRDDGQYSGGNLAKDGDRLYLGDVTAVGLILRDAAGDVMKLGEDPREVSEWLADVFLGKHEKEHIPIPGWNEPGGIDDVLGQWFGAGPTPEITVANAAMKLFGDLIDLAKYAVEPGVTSDLWKDQVDALIGQYALYFVGVSPQTQNTVL